MGLQFNLTAVFSSGSGSGSVWCEVNKVLAVTEKVLVVLELLKAPFSKCLMSSWVIKDDEGGMGDV